MKNKGVLFLISILLLIGIVFAAHTATVSVSPNSSYETLKKAYTLTLINDGTSSDSINNVTITLNGFNLNEIKPIPNWIYTTNGNAVNFLTSIASIAPGFGGPFTFNATANTIVNYTSYNFNVVTQDTINSTYGSSASVGVLNDINAPQISNVSPITKAFIKSTGYIFSLNYLEQESSFNSAQILYNYDTIYETNPWPYNGIKPMNCTDNYCSTLFDFSDNTLNYKYLTTMLNLSDIVNNINTSKIYVVLDSDIPQINLVGPPNNFSTNYVGDGNFQFNAYDESFNNSCSGSCTGKLYPELYCKLTLDYNAINNTIVNDTSQNYDIWTNITVLGDGIHYWDITCEDKAGWINTSETRNFTIDRTGPDMELTYPSQSGITIANTTIISISVKDALSGINTVSGYTQLYSITLINDSETNFNINTSNWTDGLNLIIIFANDSLGNSNNLTINFTLDILNPPAIYLNSPANSSLNNENVNFSYNISDNYSPTSLCYLNIRNVSNTVIYNNGTTVNNGTTNSISTSLQNGTYTWNVLCSDQGNNLNQSETRTLNVDAIAPNVTLTYPNNSAVTPNAFVDFNFTVYDENIIQNCSLYLNNQLNSTVIPPLILNDPNYIQQTNISVLLGQGTYTWYVKCYDNVNNEGKSNKSGLDSFTLYYDTIPPVILINPYIFDISTSGATVSWSTDENSTSNVYWDTNKTKLESAYWNPSGIWFNAALSIYHQYSFTNLSSGTTYHYIVSSSDVAGNNVNSSINSFTTATPASPSGNPGPGSRGGGCDPEWQTGSWSKCSSNGIQTRTVIDLNNCGENENKPITSQSCIYLECKSNSDCLSGYECKSNKCTKIPEVIPTETPTEEITPPLVTGFAILDNIKANPKLAAILSILILVIILGSYYWLKSGDIPKEKVKEVISEGKINRNKNDF